MIFSIDLTQEFIDGLIFEVFEADLLNNDIVFDGIILNLQIRRTPPRIISV